MRKNIDLKVFLVMTLICCVWGGQQVAMKSIQHSISLTMQIGIRSGIAAILVLLFFNKKEKILYHLTDKKLLLAALTVGLLFSLEFFLVSAAISRTETSHVSLYLYTAPVFTAVGLHFLLPQEKLNKYQWVGIGVALIGIALAVRMGLSSEKDWSFSGDLCAVAAGFAWGLSSIIIRCSILSTAPAACTLFYQLAVTSITLCGYALFFEDYRLVPDGTVVINLLCQTVVVSFISYLVWFNLLRKYQVASLSSFILMTPVMGIIAGHIVLGEILTPGFISGAVLLLTGLLLTILFARHAGKEQI
ncbi:TPA: DMT family transporter [Serratia odorifera]|nr:DMT family transporter [Serratia odorifera]